MVLAERAVACIVPGCLDSRSGAHLMCAAHWWRVPPHLRSRLFAAWRTRKADPRDAGALRRYREVSWECARIAAGSPRVEGWWARAAALLRGAPSVSPRPRIVAWR